MKYVLALLLTTMLSVPAMASSAQSAGSSNSQGSSHSNSASQANNGHTNDDNLIRTALGHYSQVNYGSICPDGSEKCGSSWQSGGEHFEPRDSVSWSMTEHTQSHESGTDGASSGAPPVGSTLNPSPVPLPNAMWLFASALLGFVVVSNRRRI